MKDCSEVPQSLTPITVTWGRATTMFPVLSREEYRSLRLLTLHVRNRGPDRLRGPECVAELGLGLGQARSSQAPPCVAPCRTERHLRAGLHQRCAHLVHGQLHHHGGPLAGHPASPGGLREGSWWQEWWANCGFR